MLIAQESLLRAHGNSSWVPTFITSKVHNNIIFIDIAMWSRINQSTKLPINQARYNVVSHMKSVSQSGE